MEEILPLSSYISSSTESSSEENDFEPNFKNAKISIHFANRKLIFDGISTKEKLANLQILNDDVRKLLKERANYFFSLWASLLYQDNDIYLMTNHVYKLAFHHITTIAPDDLKRIKLLLEDTKMLTNNWYITANRLGSKINKFIADAKEVYVYLEEAVVSERPLVALIELFSPELIEKYPPINAFITKPESSTQNDAKNKYALRNIFTRFVEHGSTTESLSEENNSFSLNASKNTICSFMQDIISSFSRVEITKTCCKFLNETSFSSTKETNHPYSCMNDTGTESICADETISCSSVEDKSTVTGWREETTSCNSKEETSISNNCVEETSSCSSIEEKCFPVNCLEQTRSCISIVDKNTSISCAEKTSSCSSVENKSISSSVEETSSCSSLEDTSIPNNCLEDINSCRFRENSADISCMEEVRYYSSVSDIGVEFKGLKDAFSQSHQQMWDYVNVCNNSIGDGNTSCNDFVENTNISSRSVENIGFHSDLEENIDSSSDLVNPCNDLVGIIYTDSDLKETSETSNGLEETAYTCSRLEETADTSSRLEKNAVISSDLMENMGHSIDFNGTLTPENNIAFTENSNIPKTRSKNKNKFNKREIKFIGKYASDFIKSYPVLNNLLSEQLNLKRVHIDDICSFDIDETNVIQLKNLFNAFLDEVCEEEEKNWNEYDHTFQQYYSTCKIWLDICIKVVLKDGSFDSELTKCKKYRT